MRKYSVIVPVFNRPDEVGELLESLCRQSPIPHEILIIEDGSDIKCEDIVKKFNDRLPVRYFLKENSGQGFSRNFGFEKATGDYYIIFDSDCIVPEDYFKIVDLQIEKLGLDAYGGPDKAGKDFTSIQKAISYSMTSQLTTGGIRGNKKHTGRFHPRSFNMGISKKVIDEVGGFKITRMGEDIELSIRVIRAGFKSGLIETAFVYHKRRTSFFQFFKQLRFFGRARINVSRFYPEELNLIHLMPLLLILGEAGWLFGSIFNPEILITGIFLNSLFILLNIFLAFVEFRSIKVAILGVVAAYIQLIAYGTGLFTEGLRKIFFG